jgi:hypothetical protein
MSCRSEAAVMLRAPLAVPGAAAARVSRAGVEVGQAYLDTDGLCEGGAAGQGVKARVRVDSFARIPGRFPRVRSCLFVFVRACGAFAACRRATGGRKRRNPTFSGWGF